MRRAGVTGGQISQQDLAPGVLAILGHHPLRIDFLPGLEHVDVPATLFVSARLDDGRWLTSSWTDSIVHVVDLAGGGEATRLFPRPAQLVGLDDEAAMMHEVPMCCIDGDYRDEGPVWRVPLDGSPAELMARRAGRWMRRTADDRIVTTVGADEQFIGSLILVDPDTQAELALDERVFLHSLEVGWTGEDDIIAYSVSDGDRSGVYLARLPPRERSAARTARRVPARVFDVVPGPTGPVPRARELTEPVDAASSVGGGAP